MNLYTEVEFDVEAAVEAASNNIPKEEKEKFEKYQEEQRAKLESTDPNIVHGKRAIEIAEGALTFLKPGEDDGQIDFEWTRMAEGYALLGDFHKAAELTRNEDKRREYQQIIDAHTNLDCPCPLKEKHDKYTVQVRFPKLKFPTGTLYECSRCKNLTVK